MQDAAINALNNEKMVGGESVNKFEEEFAKYIGTDYAVSLNSGSSGILLTFYSLRIQPGNRVIAPSATFIATLNGPCLLGAIPVFCEIGNDYVISTQALRKILKTMKCKFIIPVHLYGHPCNMHEIMEIAQTKNLTLIEDAAQAHGARYGRKKIGSFGEAAVFSFYPTKNMTVGGDGGMVTTSNKKIYDSLLKMRDVGRRTKYIHDEIGYTLRLNSVNAAIGKVQLHHLDRWNEKRKSAAKIYDSNLNGVGDILLPPQPKKSHEPVYHLYVIKTEYRNALGAWLSMNGVSTGIHYPLPVHRQPAYLGYQSKFDLSFTDDWSKTVLSIPIHPNLDFKDQKYIIEMIHRFFDDRRYESESVIKESKKWLIQ
jgi:dTDP-4-amino-4,6-dideoxygalactose transaminase